MQAPYNVEWLWGPTKGSNVWIVAPINPDTVPALDNASDYTVLHPSSVPFDVPQGSEIFRLRNLHMSPPRASTTAGSSPGTRTTIDWETSHFERDPLSGDWKYSKKNPRAPGNMDVVPPCRETRTRRNREPDHLPDTVVVRGLPLDWFGIGCPRYVHNCTCIRNCACMHGVWLFRIKTEIDLAPCSVFFLGSDLIWHVCCS